VPGILTFKVEVSFADSTRSPVTITKEINVGIRTDDIAVIAWINPDEVLLNTTGVDEDIIRYYPVNGSRDMSFLQIGRTTIHLLQLAVEGDVGSGLAPHPTQDRQMTNAEKTYVLHWLFHFAGNQCELKCPPRPGFSSISELVTFGESMRTRYKRFSHLQMKYLTDGVKLRGTPEFIHKRAVTGRTEDPLAGLPVDGQDGPKQDFRRILTSSAYQINDGSPAQPAVDAFNALVYPKKWNNIGSRIEFSLSLGTGSGIFRQVFPTYSIYVNLINTEIRPQSESPVANFNDNPYPPGPAPFVP
jgi:hypothetical protein